MADRKMRKPKPATAGIKVTGFNLWPVLLYGHLIYYESSECSARLSVTRINRILAKQEKRNA